MTETTKKSTFKTFHDFIWAFKKMLVCRYNWGVDDASKFDTNQLEEYYNNGTDIFESYFTLFNVEQDLQS